MEGLQEHPFSDPSPANSFFLVESTCAFMPVFIEAGKAGLLFIIHSTNIDSVPLMNTGLF